MMARARVQPAPRVLRRGKVVVAGRRLSTRALAAALERVGINVRRIGPDDLEAVVGEPNVVAVVGVTRPGEELARQLDTLAAKPDAPPVFVAYTRQPPPKAVRALYEAGAQGVFSWPRERRELLYALMRIDSVVAPGGRPAATNTALARRVRKRLRASPADLGTSIRVRAVDDIVVLRGNVDALWKISAAVKAARATRGVARVIAKHLEVAPGGMPDRWVAESVRRMLRSAARVDASTIAVSVRDGAVTLAGSVASRSEMNRLLSLVEHANGVRSIRNLTTVSKADKRTDRATARAVRAAVATECPTADLDVAAFGNVAVIAGRVRPPDHPSVVEEVAHRQPGIERVVNKVRVYARL